MAQFEYNGPDDLRIIYVLAAVALFFHGVLDPLLSFLFIPGANGVAEGNPFMWRFMQAGAIPFALIQLPFYFGVLACVVLNRYFIRVASDRWQSWIYRMSIGLYLGLAVWGVLLVARNLLIFYVQLWR